ncbi:Hypothetical predicted protein [Pelobates cultripes]|uniref:Endonuclease/exonuclease/phosphatase domain-containing protein n=1 Tax=Pelobates cultripes TaxID=61616 RepID=A0AAD1QWL4_PELCU|nr:Hypothetical predicted protein [Pelobates cultripes]
MTDHAGRYVFVRGRILDETYTFANIYAPNTRLDKFLWDALRALHDFTAGCLVLGGDLNIALHPTVDASRGHSSTPLPTLLKVAQDVQQTLTNYFAENPPQDTSPLLTWEAHKCVIRGILISR